MSDDALLKNGERIDDLQCNGFRIIQDPSQFCFGMDAVLLANFATGRKRAVGMDLCTGTGIIPLLMLAKDKAASFTAVEIQPEMADMAGRSAALNNVSDRMNVVCGNICDINPPKQVADNDVSNCVNDTHDVSELSSNGVNDVSDVIDDAENGSVSDVGRLRSEWREKFNIVTSNPPYIADTGGLHNPNDSVNIARHEIMMKLEDLIRAASYLLKMGGSFAMVHKPFRMAEIMELLRKYKLEPKRMQLVQPREGSEPNMVLIESYKGGHPGLRILPTLNIYKEGGIYTEELLHYYGM